MSIDSTSSARSNTDGDVGLGVMAIGLIIAVTMGSVLQSDRDANKAAVRKEAQEEKAKRMDADRLQALISPGVTLAADLKRIEKRVVEQGDTIRTLEDMYRYAYPTFSGPRSELPFFQGEFTSVKLTITEDLSTVLEESSLDRSSWPSRSIVEATQTGKGIDFRNRYFLSSTVISDKDCFTINEEQLKLRASALMLRKNAQIPENSLPDYVFPYVCADLYSQHRIAFSY